MPTKPTPVHYFNCGQCGLYFTTLDAGLSHLRRAPEHVAESLDLMEAHGSKYRSVAARKLTVSCVLSTEEADALISDLEVRRAIRDAPSTLKRKSNRQRNRVIESDSDIDSPVRKRSSKSSIVSCPPSCTATQLANTRVQHTQSQAVANVNANTNAPITVLAPITVRVTIFDRPRAEEYCNFLFDRAKHTTIRKLLDAAAAAYKAQTGSEVDFAARSRVRMMMKLFDAQGEAVGGRVCENRDLEKVVKAKGEGWFGQLEVG